MSAWKPKLKALTEEEAIALGKRELAKFWSGSEPLFMAIEAEGKASVHPLGPAFTEGDFLLLFADPTFHAGQSAMAYLREWHRRFSAHEIRMIFVHEPAYSFLADPEKAERMLRLSQNPFIVLLDPGRILAKAFNAGELPGLVFYSKGKRIFSRSGRSWLEGAEAGIHTYLRASDRGLPLAPFYRNPGDVADSGFLEFSDKRLYPKPGFQPDAEDQWTVDLPALRAGAAGPFSIGGKWTMDEDGISTGDPSASIDLQMRGSTIAVLAAPGEQSAEIAVELDNRPLYDAVAGEAVCFSEDGTSVARFSDPSVLKLLTRLAPGEHRVTLRFPKAAEDPVRLYGLRFGQES